MKRLFSPLFIFCLVISCSSSKLIIPESNIDPNDPNHPPILISHGELSYPDLGARTNVVGDVFVELKIDSSGTVTDVKIIDRKFNVSGVYRINGEITGVDELFDEPTINFYKHCKFEPGLNNGKPVEYIIQTSMHFEIID